MRHQPAIDAWREFWAALFAYVRACGGQVPDEAPEEMAEIVAAVRKIERAEAALAVSDGLPQDTKP